MTKIIKVLKDFTYYSLIKEAIYSTKDMQATASEIFDYFVLKFPNIFTKFNSMTWKGNIRQVLSKNPEFIKRAKSGNSKQHYWSHRPIEVLIAESRQNNNSTVFELQDENNTRAIAIDKYPNYLKQKRLTELDTNRRILENKNYETQKKFEFTGNFDYRKLFDKKD